MNAAELIDRLTALVKLQADIIKEQSDALEQARAVADELENITAKTHWPFPVYSELLFSV